MKYVERSHIHLNKLVYITAQFSFFFFFFWKSTAHVAHGSIHLFVYQMPSASPDWNISSTQAASQKKAQCRSECPVNYCLHLMKYTTTSYPVYRHNMVMYRPC